MLSNWGAEMGAATSFLTRFLAISVRAALAGALFAPAPGMAANHAASDIGVEATCRLDGQQEVKIEIVLDKEGNQVSSLADCRKWLATERSEWVRKMACVPVSGVDPKLKSIKCVQMKAEGATKPKAAP